MRKRTMAMIGGAGFLLVSVVVIGAGLLPLNSNAHPPCEELPSVAEVQEALANHDDLVSELADQGKGVRVGVGTPCTTPDDVGLVSVTFNSREEEEGVADVLTKSEGFGVPVFVDHS